MHLDAQAINSVEAFSKADTCARYPDVYFRWKTAKEFIKENHRYGNELSILKKKFSDFSWLVIAPFEIKKCHSQRIFHFQITFLHCKHRQSW